MQRPSSRGMPTIGILNPLSPLEKAKASHDVQVP